jgi:molybdenum-dependent DNA-binding transcriptional regulator ModE
MLDLKRLAVLREVGARGSLAAAAKALSYTPSAVSQQMTALSRDIGVALFERTPRGMRLTDSAHALIAHCETVFDRLAQAQADLEAIAGGAAAGCDWARSPPRPSRSPPRRSGASVGFTRGWICASRTVSRTRAWSASRSGSSTSR